MQPRFDLREAVFLALFDLLEKKFSFSSIFQRDNIFLSKQAFLRKKAFSQKHCFFDAEP